MLRKYGLLAMSVSLLVAMPAVALATPGFPGTIRAHLGLEYQPPCTLCHGSVQGGGPVVTAFGRSLLDRGLRAGDDASLEAALDRIVSDGVDSDADGTRDVDELLASTDPSSAASSSLCKRLTVSSNRP